MHLPPQLLYYRIAANYCPHVVSWWKYKSSIHMPLSQFFHSSGQFLQHNMMYKVVTYHSL